MLPLKFGECGRIDHRLKVKIHPKLREHLDLTQALHQRQLIFGDPIGIQSPRQRTGIIKISANATPPKFGGASK